MITYCLVNSTGEIIACERTKKELNKWIFSSVRLHHRRDVN